MARVFLSYRRSDTKWAVGRIYDRLAELFDPKSLFLDVSDIEPGDDFADRIQEIVEICDVLLAVIGRNWLTVTDRAGRRRLDDPNDLVRVEIATALKRGIRVVPILVDRVEMPKSSDLPDDLADLSRKNAKKVSFTQFHSDLDSLLRVLEKVLQLPVTAERETRARPSTPSRAGNAEPTKLPLTISLETLGGVATPLIKRGATLPKKSSETFSTAADNQTLISVELFWGDQTLAKDNLHLGKFTLQGIDPAPRGYPQIEITAEVDENLILTVAGRVQGTENETVLDAIDLSKIDVPEEMLAEGSAIPAAVTSDRDFHGGSASKNFFDSLFADDSPFKDFQEKYSKKK